jgi:hypothetical protein
MNRALAGSLLLFFAISPLASADEASKLAKAREFSQVTKQEDRRSRSWI